MNMTRATRQIRPARIPNQESSAPIRVPSPLCCNPVQIDLGERPLRTGLLRFGGS